MSLHSIFLIVDGQFHKANVSGNLTLLQFLRDTHHLVGVKDGCAEVDCGACTVIFNGQAVKSCLALAAQADGAEILTAEGLAGSQSHLCHDLPSARTKA